MKIEKVVIPVAGLGTRLLPATKSQPKEMLPVGRKPVVQYVVEEMLEQSFKKILFITGRDKRSIEDHFDRDPELKCYLPGIPRAMYMPYPFQIIQSTDSMLISYEFADASRIINMKDHQESQD